MRSRTKRKRNIKSRKPIKPSSKKSESKEFIPDYNITEQDETYIEYEVEKQRKEVIMMNEGQVELYFRRGEFFFDADDYDKAIDDFSKVLEFVKNGGTQKTDWLSHAIFRAIANAHKWRNNPGDKEKALDYLNEGIEFLAD